MRIMLVVLHPAHREQRAAAHASTSIRGAARINASALSVLSYLSLCGCLAARTAGGATGESTRLPGAGESASESPLLASPVPGVDAPMPAHDAEASRLARARLERTLARLASGPRFALGHEDTTAYGVGWSGDTDRSDVKSLCGTHVAVYGWDLFGVEKGAPKNGDGVDFEHMRRLIGDAHRRGGINTISWHLDNPTSGGNAWDRTPAVHDILPGQPRHALYRGYLDRAASFLSSLRGDSNELIPIIFRPFHEHTGSWFWWGGSHTNAQDYIALWRYTVDYLRHERGLDNLLFAFSPSGGDVHTDADYLYRYPGDAYVDVLGVDHYYSSDPKELVRVAEVVVRVAEARGKVPALTEFGARGGLNGAGIAPNWLVDNFLLPLKQSRTASRIAYALAWRNASPEHCFLPYPEHPGATAFKALCTDDQLVLEDDLAHLE